MALDRLTPTSATPGPVDGDGYMDEVAEEVTGLWNRSICTLSGIGGTADAITAALVPALTGSLVDGMGFWLKPTAQNTGPVTIAINGAAAVNLVDANGDPLTAGSIIAGRRYLLAADGGALRVVSGSGGGSSAAGGYRKLVFAASGTWTKPDGLVSVRVTVLGGGGGGGGVNNGDSVGSGGGGGGLAEKEIAAGSLADTVTVTVGAGGTAATASSGSVAGTGGSSSFGAHCVATGGAGGVTSGSGNTTGGGPGIGTTGDLLVPGFKGGDTELDILTFVTKIHGFGGAGALRGGHNYAVATSGVGANGRDNTGQGGAGAYTSSTSNFGGSIGGSGLVIVEEFY